MKSVFTLFILAISLIGFAQSGSLKTTKFEYSENGLNDYVVVNIDAKSKVEIYSKTMNWIKETYKNPDLVLKMKIENEKLRLDALAINLLKCRGLRQNLNYTLEISFKENKYKFEIVSLLYETTDYKAIPNFKTDTRMIKNFGNTPTDIENYFNKLNKNLEEYICNKVDDNW